MNSISFFKALLMKEIDEELKGGQKKLDVAEPKGKITAADFAALRAKKDVKKEGEDHEVSMAHNSLESIIRSAMELKVKLGDDEKDIPAWIQDHITNADNYINQASKNYHEYSNGEHDFDELPDGTVEVPVGDEEDAEMSLQGLMEALLNEASKDPYDDVKKENSQLEEKVDMDELEFELKRLKQENPGKKVTYDFITDPKFPKGYVIYIDGKILNQVGDIVIPNKGEHKGQKHKVIHVFDDGSMNIQPVRQLSTGEYVVLSAKDIKYRQGAIKAKPKDIEEAKKKPSAGLTKKQKSTIAKKAASGKDIGKKGKGFEKIASKAAKKYGSKERGQAVAAAAMWKSAAKKAK